jgi:hypothetical protein
LKRIAFIVLGRVEAVVIFCRVAQRLIVARSVSIVLFKLIIIPRTIIVLIVGEVVILSHVAPSIIIAGSFFIH